MKHTYFKSSKKEFKDSIVNQNENHEREIFSWRQGYPHTSFTYILSKDIFRHHRCQKDEADVLMVKGKSWCDKNIKIVAAGSNIDSQNPIALQVKYNDLQHNFQRGKDYPDLQKKHGKALEMIKAAIEKCSQVDIYHVPEDCSIAVGIFACGCFWGAQHQFQKQPGVLNTLAGYTGGKEAFPSYADVRDHKTHHVEAVIVEFNPQQVSYESLCKLFFEIHDPAQTDGVGPDLGPQYRSCIFYRNESQKQTAEHVTELLRSKGDEVNTLLLPEETFYIGEAYHQHYYEKTGGEPYCHLRTKKF